MDKIIGQQSTANGCRYECVAPNGSRVQTASCTEALFWYSIGYLVRRFSSWALNAQASQRGA